MKYDEALRFRRSVELAAVLLPDERAAQVPCLFPPWGTGRQYAAGDRVRYNGVLYKVLQAHTSQADWTPDVAVSLYAKVLNDEIREWEQPTSTNPYMKGDRVKHNGLVWISDIDNNVWEPGVYGWTQLLDE